MKVSVILLYFIKYINYRIQSKKKKKNLNEEIESLKEKKNKLVKKETKEIRNYYKMYKII